MSSKTLTKQEAEDVYRAVGEVFGKEYEASIRGKLAALLDAPEREPDGKCATCGGWAPLLHCADCWDLYALPPKDAPEAQPRTPGLCSLCGEPMPKGEEMFKYHGYSGPCPKDRSEAQP